VFNHWIKKIVIVGTTGSGKTSFLKLLPGVFKGSEVQRKVSVEEKVDDTFTPLESDQFQNSTTTIGINTKSVLFLTSRSNVFTVHELRSNGGLPYSQEEIDSLYPVVVFDTAGQERFKFMQEIGLKGAHGVIIFADGSNMSSIEKVADYLLMVQEEEQRVGRRIPTVVFINKKDLESKGLFIGKDAVRRWLPDPSIKLYETTIYDFDSFMLPLREFLHELDGFPLDINSFTALNYA